MGCAACCSARLGCHLPSDACISRWCAQTDFCRAGHRSRLSSNDLGGSAVLYGAHSQQAKVRVVKMHFVPARSSMAQSAPHAHAGLLFSNAARQLPEASTARSPSCVLTSHITPPLQWEDAQRLLDQEGATTDWRMLYQRRCGAWGRGIIHAVVNEWHACMRLFRCAACCGRLLPCCCTHCRCFWLVCAEVERAWISGDSSGRVLTGHSDFIRCAQLEGSTLVTASGSFSHKDCTIR